jgi:hypothetical protein
MKTCINLLVKGVLLISLFGSAANLFASGIAACETDVLKKIEADMHGINHKLAADGSIYLYGTYKGSLKIDELTAPESSSNTIFVAKFSPCGTPVWLIHGGSSGNDTLTDLTTDADGNVFITMIFINNITIHGTGNTTYSTARQHAGDGDGLMLKLNNKGEILWGVTIKSGSKFNGFLALELDVNNNIYVAGIFGGCCPTQSTVTISGPVNSVNTSIIGYLTGILVKIAPDGRVLWNARVGSRDAAMSPITITDDFIFVGGQFRSWNTGTSAQLVDGTGAPHTVLNPGIGTAFIVKLDHSGKHIWNVSLGNNGVNGWTGLGIGTLNYIDNELWVTGSYHGGAVTFRSVNQENLTLPASAHYIGFIARYAASGNAMKVANLNIENQPLHPSSLDLHHNQVILSGSFLEGDRRIGVLRTLSPELGTISDQLISGEGNVTVSRVTNRNGLIFSGLFQQNVHFSGQSLSGSGAYLHISKNTATEPNPEPAINVFTLPVTVSDAFDNKLTLILGTAEDASYDYNPLYDAYAPPPPPDGVFDARLTDDTESYMKRFLPAGELQLRWRLQFRPESGGAPITVSWSEDSLPEQGNFFLRDVISAQFFDVNMRHQTSVTVDQAFISSLELVYSVNSELEVDYVKGWNLLSLPLALPGSVYSNIFAEAVENTLYKFASVYTSVTELEAGQGYWLRLASNSKVKFEGTTIGRTDLQLQRGWNLIGGISETAIIEDPDSIVMPGSLYGFNGVYGVVDKLSSGRGYWVRATQAGVISVIPDESLEKVPAAQPEPQALATIRFETGEHRQNLYLGWQETYEAVLPPLPPSGAFDVRLEKDLMGTEFLSGRISVQQSGEPLYMWMDLDADFTWLVRMWMGAELLSERYAVSGERIVVNPRVDAIEFLQREVAGGDGMPEILTLEQNFPNPFNPTTAIRYALPEAAQVRLEVYTVAGQRVAILASGEQRAGWHTATFDGSSLASGVYIYRLEAGGFVQTRKLMLIK